mgnify:CR=1 FL=1
MALPGKPLPTRCLVESAYACIRLDWSTVGRIQYGRVRLDRSVQGQTAPASPRLLSSQISQALGDTIALTSGAPSGSIALPPMSIAPAPPSRANGAAALRSLFRATPLAIWKLAFMSEKSVCFLVSLCTDFAPIAAFAFRKLSARLMPFTAPSFICTLALPASARLSAGTVVPVVVTSSMRMICVSCSETCRTRWNAPSIFLIRSLLVR